MVKSTVAIATTLQAEGRFRIGGGTKSWHLDDSYSFISRFLSTPALTSGQVAGNGQACTSKASLFTMGCRLRASTDLIRGTALSHGYSSSPKALLSRISPAQGGVMRSRQLVNHTKCTQVRPTTLVDLRQSVRWFQLAPMFQGPRFWKRRRKIPAINMIDTSFESIPSDRRWFRDYFTARLPGSSLHPDSAPASVSGARESTVVRIPLRSAKHHLGAARARGTRPYNEDHFQNGVIDIPTFSPPSTGDDGEPSPSDQEDSVFYFGVFDGHGGEDCSKFLKENLHTYIEQTWRCFNVDTPPREAATERRKDLQNSLITAWKETVGGYFRRFRPRFGRGSGSGISGDGSIEAVLTYAFLRADLDFITRTPPWFSAHEDGKSDELKPKLNTTTTPFKGGSTASVVLISTPSSKLFWNPQQSSTLVTAHIGDTRILLCRTSDGLAVPLTTNHHPSAPLEARRLQRYATAFVLDSFGEERFGVLSNTRAFGDVRQKRLGVSAEPDLTSREILPSEYSFLVLISDGISAVLSDQEIVDIVKECKTPDDAATELVEFVDEVGEIGDNATAIVVRLGGWEKRAEGGEGWMGTKPLRAWKRDEALGRVGGRRM